MTESQPYQIYLILALAVVTMLIMAGAIILFVVFYQKRMLKEQMKRQILEYQYQQKMLQAELESQELERRRLAEDLHDSIGGMLSTIRVGLTTVARGLPDPQSIAETKQMLDDTITSVRRISRDLMPSTLEKFGLTHALTELCERFQATSRIQIDATLPEEDLNFGKHRELMIFRIVQELLNNAIKHAQATRINVLLLHENSIVVKVEDDGIGFDPAAFQKKTGKGLGLFNIENRVRLLGATLEYVRGRQRGSEVIITIPGK